MSTTTAVLAWDAPTDNGEAISSYRLVYGQRARNLSTMGTSPAFQTPALPPCLATNSTSTPHYSPQLPPLPPLPLTHHPHLPGHPSTLSSHIPATPITPVTLDHRERLLLNS